MDTSGYVVRKPKVRDMRELAKVPEDERPYEMAVRCISRSDGRQLTMDELMDMDASLFGALMSMMNPGEAGNGS